jgi:hypothetical protein
VNEARDLLCLNDGSTGAIERKADDPVARRHLAHKCHEAIVVTLHDRSATKNEDFFVSKLETRELHAERRLRAREQRGSAEDRNPRQPTNARPGGQSHVGGSILVPHASLGKSNAMGSQIEWVSFNRPNFFLA